MVGLRERMPSKSCFREWWEKLRNFLENAASSPAGGRLKKKKKNGSPSLCKEYALLGERPPVVVQSGGDVTAAAVSGKQ